MHQSAVPSGKLLSPFYFPFMIVSALAVFWTIVSVPQKASGPRDYLLKHLHVSILAVAHHFYIDMTRNLLRIVHCVDVDQKDQYAISTSRYWVEYPDAKCYKGAHLALTLGLGATLLMSMTIGMPIGILAILVRNRQRLDDEEFMWTFGFLYKSYDTES